MRTDSTALFWDKVERAGDCWIWTGSTNGHGYGRLTRWQDGRNRSHAAHRFAWELLYGPIPSGSLVLHRCDVTLCVRPAHLFLGDKRANAIDSVAKGRSVGGRGRFTRLTEQDVRQIRSAYDDGVSMRVLATDFGVSWSAIHGAIRRKHWRHVS